MMVATVIVTKDRNNDGDIKQEQQEPQEPPRPLPLAAQGAKGQDAGGEHHSKHCLPPKGKESWPR